jgi:hypothetical protein
MPFQKGDVPKNKVDVSAEDRALISSLYSDGHTLRSLSARTGLSAAWLSEHLRAWGVQRDARAVRRRRKRLGSVVGADLDFLRSWTPESAWVWGLWFGDGWLRPYRVSMAASEEVARKVQELSGASGAVTPGNGCVHLDLGGTDAVLLVEDQFGLVPGPKSDALSWPEIPPRLEAHFLRGLWDADGSFYMQASKGRGYLGTTFCSKSASFAGDVRDAVGRLGGQTRPVERNRGQALVRWNGRHAKALGSLLYAESEDRMRCSRKHAIWEGA